MSDLGTHATMPQVMFATSSIHDPMETIAFAFSLPYPIELTRLGAYAPIVDDGARPEIVSRTWGINRQLVNYNANSVIPA